MKVEKTRKSLEFIEQDEEFIKQIAKDVGCHYCKTNKLTFYLSTLNTATPSKASIFAWVHKGDKESFWVATRKSWLDKARNASNSTHFPLDIQDSDTISFDTAENYDDTIRVLKLLNDKHPIKNITA